MESTAMNMLTKQARISSQYLFLTVFTLALTALLGCSSSKAGRPAGKARAYNLKLVPGESLKESSATVDVVGVNPSELEKWRNYSIKEYFRPGDPLRTDAQKATVSFVPGRQEPLVLKTTDPIWNKWLKAGVQYVVVVADLPGVFPEGKVGSQDPRRQLVPLGKKCWDTSDLEVKVQAGGVTVVTTPREGCSPPAW
jgi:hypothetical protein